MTALPCAQMLPLVCNDAVCMIFVFDLSRLETLSSLRDWYKQVSAVLSCCAFAGQKPGRDDADFARIRHGGSIKVRSRYFLAQNTIFLHRSRPRSKLR